MESEVVREIIQRPIGNRKRPKEATIDAIQGRHRRMAQLAAVGMTVGQIAKQLDMTVHGVKYAMKSPIVSQHVRALQAAGDQQAINVHDEIKRMLPACLEVLETCVTDEELPMKLRSDRAIQVLSMAGYGPQKNVNVRGQMQHAFLTAEQIDELKAAADRALDNGITLVDEEEAIDVSPA